MNKATAALYLTLGVLAGIMGIEHGIGEVLEAIGQQKAYSFYLGLIRRFSR